MSLSSLASRIRWMLIRTPYRTLVKRLACARAGRAVADRRAVFADVDLDPAQQRALASLREVGYADASEVIERELLEAAYEATMHKIRTENRKEEVRLNPNKDFWERLLDEDLDESGRQPSDSPFVQIAASERVLDLVARYFEDAPLLDYVHLLHSQHKPGPLKVSQLWHRDYDDEKLLKLFVYFTDCDEEADGPFTFLPADLSGQIGFSMHSHRADSELGVENLQTKATAMKGPRLSAFFVDTGRCYHMGSRVAPGHERVLYMAAYATYPKFNGRPACYFSVTSPLSERQRVSLTYA